MRVRGCVGVVLKSTDTVVLIMVFTQWTCFFVSGR